MRFRKSCSLVASLGTLTEGRRATNRLNAKVPIHRLQFAMATLVRFFERRCYPGKWKARGLAQTLQARRVRPSLATRSVSWAQTLKSNEFSAIAVAKTVAFLIASALLSMSARESDSMRAHWKRQLRNNLQPPYEVLEDEKNVQQLLS